MCNRQHSTYGQSHRTALSLKLTCDELRRNTQMHINNDFNPSCPCPLRQPLLNITDWGAWAIDIYSQSWRTGVHDQGTARLVSPEAPPHGLQTSALPSCCVFPGHLSLPAIPAASSSFYTDTSHSGSGPTLLAHFVLITFVKTLSPNVLTFWGARG